MAYTGFLIKNQKSLLAGIPPIFDKVFADHVTVCMGVGDSPKAATLKVVAVVSNDRIQAGIVTVDDEYVRPDGKIFHVTLSLDSESGARPAESNELIKSATWNFIQPVYLSTQPWQFVYGMPNNG